MSTFLYTLLQWLSCNNIFKVLLVKRNEVSFGVTVLTPMVPLKVPPKRIMSSDLN